MKRTLRTLRTMQPSSLAIDREAGVITGVAVITAGPTLEDAVGNPPVVVDAVTLKQVVDFINASSVGVKSRMTHESTINGTDEIRDRVGYFRNARIDGDVVRADFHAHAATDPNTVKLMSIAEQDATSAGVSIVSHKSYAEPTAKGAALRLDSLEAVDWVGQPAANPSGIFSTKPGGTLSPKATGQDAQKGFTMNLTPEQIAYLQSIGLSPEATAEDITAFLETLTPEQQAELEAAAPAAASADPAPAPAQPAPVAAGRKPVKPAPKRQPVQPAADPVATVQELNELATLAGMPAEWVVQMQIEGKTEPEARAIVLAKKQGERKPVSLSGSPAPRITGGEDLNLSTLSIAIQDAICEKAGVKLIKWDRNEVALSAAGKPQPRQAHERSREFAGRSVVEMGRKWLMSLGHRDADLMSKTELVSLLLSRQRQRRHVTALAHSTSDFPEILSDVMGKNLRAAYVLSDPQWKKFVEVVNADSFKSQKFYQTGSLGSLVAINEAGEYTFTTMTESKETATLQKYGRAFAYTWEMMINDDMNAFGRMPAELASLAVDLEETTAFSPLNTGPTMAETTRSLFNTTDNTLADGTGNVGAPSVTLLDKGNVALGTRRALANTGETGRPLSLKTKFLIVPPALEFTATNLIDNPVLVGATNNSKNYFANKFEIISSQYLTSSTAWFMLASGIQTLGLMFLEGNQSPTVTEEEQFSNDTVAVKMRHVVAPVVFDWRGFWKNPGA